MGTRRTGRSGPAVAPDAGTVVIEQEAAARMEHERQTRLLELRKKQDDMDVDLFVPGQSGE
jgi:hypothetical protein